MMQIRTEVAEIARAGRFMARTWHRARLAIAVVAMAALVGLGGCGARLPLLPNSDPALRKKPADFAADAALRHPFKDDAPSGGEAKGRADVDYSNGFVEVVNLSDEDWNDVEFWINRRYVVFVPKLEKNGPKVTTLNFWMFYDEKGNAFHTTNGPDATRITQLEMYRAGKMYTLKLQLAD
jgi:hypothetical protein